MCTASKNSAVINNIIVILLQTLLQFASFIDKPGRCRHKFSIPIDWPSWIIGFPCAYKLIKRYANYCNFVVYNANEIAEFFVWSCAYMAFVTNWKNIAGYTH